MTTRRPFAAAAAVLVAVSVIVWSPPPVVAASPVDIVVVGGTQVVTPAVEELLKTCTTGTVTRIAGADRYQTAAALSAATFPSSDGAYIATGFDFPDALAGVSAAGLADALIQLVNSQVPGVVWSELDRLGVSWVVALGGPSAIPQTVVDALGSKYAASRLAGNNRFETAAAIVQDAFTTADTVYIATGLDFPDALSGGAAAGAEGSAILLVQPDSIPAPTAKQLARLKPTTIKILGGTAAVSANVATQLAGYANSIQRISGNDRYTTAANISKATFSPGPDTIYITTGLDYPDALGAGPAATHTGGPILLTSPERLPEPTQNELFRLTGTKCQDLPSGYLSVKFVADRQGDATLYQGPCGEVGLIDTNMYRSQEVLTAMDALGTRNLEWISVSHYDADHVGGIVDVGTAPGVTVGTVYDRGGDRNVKDSATYRTYYDWVTSTGKRDPVDIGNTFSLCSGVDRVTFTVVSVGTDGTAAGGIPVSDENDRGICLHVEFVSFDLATCGDINGTNDGTRSDVESAVAATIGNVEVAKVNHHGSSYSSNATYVSTLSAQVSVIFVGKNSYGHPAASVVAAWDAIGDVYQTQSALDNSPVDGTITVATDGTDGFSVNTTQGNFRYYTLDP